MLDPRTAHAALCEPVAAYLAARAKAEVLMEQVDGIKTKMLAETAYLDDDGERITESKYAWTVCDEQAATWFAELERRTNEAIPHDLPAGHCPALTADSARVQAEADLLNAGSKLLDFPGDRVYKLDLRRKLIDNMVGLVLAAEREMAA